MKAPTMTQAQRRVLRRLATAPNGTLLRGVPELPTRTLETLAARGWISLDRAGYTATITDDGRDVELRDRTGFGGAR